MLGTFVIPVVLYGAHFIGLSVNRFSQQILGKKKKSTCNFIIAKHKLQNFLLLLSFGRNSKVTNTREEAETNVTPVL